MVSRWQPLTVVVRLLRDDEGAVSGVVERVRTGEKVRVASVAQVAEVLADMLDATGAVDPGGRGETR